MSRDEQKKAGWGPWTRYRKTARSLWYIDKQVPPPPVKKKIGEERESTQATGNVETLACLANNEERLAVPVPFPGIIRYGKEIVTVRVLTLSAVQTDTSVG